MARKRKTYRPDRDEATYRDTSVCQATVISSTVQRSDVSRQAEYTNDFSEVDVSEGQYLEPPYDPDRVLRIIKQSNTLPPCIECMVTNVGMYGFDIEATGSEQDMDPGEVALLRSFIEKANPEESLLELNEKRLRDYESLGYSYMEVIRDANKRVSMFRHAPGHTIRMTSRGKPVDVTETIDRGGKPHVIRRARRFRKFVQSTSVGSRVYFKEFGDPRDMDYRTGEYGTAKNPVPVRYRATEILHQKQDSNDPYGEPRWISQITSALGSRASEEVNLRYFEDNTVPPMIVSVSGGRLTRQSYKALESLLSAQGVGKDRQHKILLLEAIAESADLEGSSNVQFKVDKLTDARQSDGLFSDYDKSNRDKIRSAFRLHPVLIGFSDGHNYASVQVSIFVAEMQVFTPERTLHDSFLNNRLVNNDKGLGLKTVRLKSQAPSLTTPEKLVQAFTAFNVMGAITPRDSVDLFKEVTQIQLPQYPNQDEEGYAPWMDEPSYLLGRNRQHEDQQRKTPEIKDTEETGDISFSYPEHGQE